MSSRARKWTRRTLLATGGVLGGGLVVGAGFFALAPNRLRLEGAAAAGADESADAAAAGASRTAAAPAQLTTWLRITPQDEVIVLVPHAELGQGAQTALAMMLADELDADWARVRVEEAPAISAYANGHVLRGFLSEFFEMPRALVRGTEYGAFKITEAASYQITGGSISVRGTGQFGLRIAGAAGRSMLLEAAARRWGVKAGECTAATSRVTHAASQRSASYGELAVEAAEIDPPQHPVLKTRERYTIMGRSQRRFDLPSKTDGSARYAIDVRVPQMRYAAVRTAPMFGERLESVDERPALKLRGVERVVRLENAVVVVADSQWHAFKGLEALQPKFSEGARRELTSEGWALERRTALDTQHGRREQREGDVEAALAKAARRIEAQYELPYLSHAAIEPMSTTVRVAEGRAEVWTGTQNPLAARRLVAKTLELDDDAVTVHNLQVGGGFGRRVPNPGDFIEQAARIAAAMTPHPVKLVWSREEDFAHGFYRPAITARFRGGLDATGNLIAWAQHYSGDATGRAGRPPYVTPDFEIRHVAIGTHVPEGPWRSVAHSHQGFLIESFIDELAQAAGRDPFDFRRAALAGRTRHLAVLERLEAMSGWREPLERTAGLRRGRGVALVQSFGSIVAETCEVEIDAAGTLRIGRCCAVVDCGLVVNPDTARAQIEGGMLFGLSAALGEQITLEAGRVAQRNFHEYPLLRFADAPRVEVEFIDSDAAPGGLGEPGTPPAAAALANAIYAASGVRVRRLPISATSFAASEGAQPSASPSPASSS